MRDGEVTMRNIQKNAQERHIMAIIPQRRHQRSPDDYQKLVGSQIAPALLVRVVNSDRTALVAKAEEQPVRGVDGKESPEKV